MNDVKNKPDYITSSHTLPSSILRIQNSHLSLHSHVCSDPHLAPWLHPQLRHPVA